MSERKESNPIVPSEAPEQGATLDTLHVQPERKGNILRKSLVALGVLALSATLILATGETTANKHEDIKTPISPTATPEAIAKPAPKIESQKYPNPVFSDTANWTQDFSQMPNGTINTKDWNVLVGPPPANQESEYYTANPSNLRIENGNLIIQAQQQQVDGYNYTSARIDTLHKEDFLYGKIEITAKIPNGIGTWPAMWLLSSNNIYNGQPIPAGSNQYYENGEIDMEEAIGSYPGTVYGIGHALLNPIESPYPAKYYSTTEVANEDTEYHTYGLEWTPTSLTFTVDGVAFYSVEKSPTDNYERWPYDQKDYLIVNLALGGSWAGRDKKDFPGDGINKAALPAQMQIQSINYFSYIG
jgi:beta-glucanase (GH16 family)